jgi:hypothetical protein
MSLSDQFQNQIDNYVNQMADYKEEFNEYKNQLVAASGQAGEVFKQLGTEIGAPIAVELLRVGATKLFGEQAGEAVSNLGGAAIRSAVNGETSSSDILQNMRNSLGPDADTAAAAESDGASALNAAREGVMSVINRVRSGGEDAVSGAEDAVASAQEGLSEAASNFAGNVVSRIQGSVADIVQTQAARLSSLANENNIVSPMNAADSTLDTSVYGDVELSNMADAVPRSGVPDLSLPYESTYEAPGFAEPMAMPGSSSNIIGRFFNQGRAEPEVAEEVAPTQEEALLQLSQQFRMPVTSDLLPEGAGSLAEGVMGRFTSIGESLSTEAASGVEGLSEAVSGAVSGATEAASGAVSAVSEAASGAVSAVSEAASGAVSAVSGAAEGAGLAAGEAAAEGVAGAATGGVGGVVVGALIGIGTLLFDIFHHDHTAPVAPPVLPALSLPSFQPGLATGD